MMSRRRFLELGFFALAGLALSGAAGCGGRSMLRRGRRGERTDSKGEEERGHRRGLGRLIRLILRRVL